MSPLGGTVGSGFARLKVSKTNCTDDTTRGVVSSLFAAASATSAANDIRICASITDGCRSIFRGVNRSATTITKSTKGSAVTKCVGKVRDGSRSLRGRTGNPFDGFISTMGAFLKVRSPSAIFTRVNKFAVDNFLGKLAAGTRDMLS